MEQVGNMTSLASHNTVGCFKSTNSVEHIAFNEKYNYFIVVMNNEFTIIDISQMVKFFKNQYHEIKDNAKGVCTEKLDDNARMIKLMYNRRCFVILCENSVKFFLQERMNTRSDFKLLVDIKLKIDDLVILKEKVKEDSESIMIMKFSDGDFIIVKLEHLLQANPNKSCYVNPQNPAEKSFNFHYMYRLFENVQQKARFINFRNPQSTENLSSFEVFLVPYNDKKLHVLRFKYTENNKNRIICVNSFTIELSTGSPNDFQIDYVCEPKPEDIFIVTLEGVKNSSMLKRFIYYIEPNGVIDNKIDFLLKEKFETNDQVEKGTITNKYNFSIYNIPSNGKTKCPVFWIANSYSLSIDIFRHNSENGYSYVYSNDLKGFNNDLHGISYLRGFILFKSNIYEKENFADEMDPNQRQFPFFIALVGNGNFLFVRHRFFDGVSIVDVKKQANKKKICNNNKKRSDGTNLNKNQNMFHSQLKFGSSENHKDNSNFQASSSINLRQNNHSSNPRRESIDDDLFKDGTVYYQVNENQQVNSTEDVLDALRPKKSNYSQVFAKDSNQHNFNKAGPFNNFDPNTNNRNQVNVSEFQIHPGNTNFQHTDPQNQNMQINNSSVNNNNFLNIDLNNTNQNYNNEKDLKNTSEAVINNLNQEKMFLTNQNNQGHQYHSQNFQGSSFGNNLGTSNFNTTGFGNENSKNQENNGFVNNTSQNNTNPIFVQENQNLQNNISYANQNDNNIQTSQNFGQNPQNQAPNNFSKVLNPDVDPNNKNGSKWLIKTRQQKDVCNLENTNNLMGNNEFTPYGDKIDPNENIYQNQAVPELPNDSNHFNNNASTTKPDFFEKIKSGGNTNNIFGIKNDNSNVTTVHKSLLSSSNNIFEINQNLSANNPASNHNNPFNCKKTTGDDNNFGFGKNSSKNNCSNQFKREMKKINTAKINRDDNTNNSAVNIGNFNNNQNGDNSNQVGNTNVQSLSKQFMSEKPQFPQNNNNTLNQQANQHIQNTSNSVLQQPPENLKNNNSMLNKLANEHIQTTSNYFNQQQNQTLENNNIGLNQLANKHLQNTNNSFVQQTQQNVQSIENFNQQAPQKIENNNNFIKQAQENVQSNNTFVEQASQTLQNNSSNLNQLANQHIQNNNLFQQAQQNLQSNDNLNQQALQSQQNNNDFAGSIFKHLKNYKQYETLPKIFLKTNLLITFFHHNFYLDNEFLFKLVFKFHIFY